MIKYLSHRHKLQRFEAGLKGVYPVLCRFRRKEPFVVRKPRRVFRLLNSDFQLPNSDVRLPTSNFRLQTSDLRLHTSNFRLHTSDFRLQTSDFRLQTSDFRLQISDFRLKTSYFRLDKVRTPDFWFLTAQTWKRMARPSDLSLPTSHFPLPTSHFWHPTSDFPLLISDFRLPTSDFQLPSSNFRLLTWLSVLLGSIAARSTTRVLMPKFKAQWKGRLHRSRHKREQLNLLLKKQLSTKPTRQPMRSAWRTDTMVLPDHEVAITKQSKHCLSYSSLHNRRLMSQARRTQHFARSAKRVWSASLVKRLLCRLNLFKKLLLRKEIPAPVKRLEKH